MDFDELAAAGRALYGERWQTSLSEDLKVADRTVRRWLARYSSIPDGIEREVRDILIKRAQQLNELIGYSIHIADTSILHHPTSTVFKFDDSGNVTLVHLGMGAWNKVPEVTEGAKRALHRERERDKETAKRFLRELSVVANTFIQPTGARTRTCGSNVHVPSRLGC